MFPFKKSRRCKFSYRLLVTVFFLFGAHVAHSSGLRAEATDWRRCFRIPGHLHGNNFLMGITHSLGGLATRAAA